MEGLASAMLRCSIRTPFVVGFFFRGVLLPFYVAQKSFLLAGGLAGLYVFYAVVLFKKSFRWLQVAGWIMLVLGVWQIAAVFSGEYGAFPLHQFYLSLIATLRLNCEVICELPCRKLVCCDNTECLVFHWIMWVDMLLSFATTAFFIGEAFLALPTDDDENTVIITLPDVHYKRRSTYSNQLVEDDDTGFYEEVYGIVSRDAPELHKEQRIEMEDFSMF